MAEEPNRTEAGGGTDLSAGERIDELTGNLRRAIDLHEGETLDAEAFERLIRAAVEENLRRGR